LQNSHHKRVALFLGGVWLIIAGVLLLGHTAALAESYIEVRKNGVVYHFTIREHPQSRRAGMNPAAARRVPSNSPTRGALPEAEARRWPRTPPPIGHLFLKQEYWNYIKEAAQKYQISPYLIQAICAIESRYDKDAKSGRCYGLMQLDKDTARKYGVDSRNPRENIMGGAAVLATLMQEYHGDIRRVLRVYNATCTAAYEREVIRAYIQAMQFEMVSLPAKKSKN
jgi:soluble lytic murein transglycosylase-like protein